MNFKYILFLIIAFSSFAKSNTILAIVGSEVITSFDLSLYDKKTSTKEERLKILNLLIEEKIENNQIKKLGIEPTNESIIKELRAIALKNNISIEELQKNPNFNLILEQLKNNLRKIAFRQLVSQDLLNKNDYPDSEIKNIYKLWMHDIKQKTYIDIYEEKL